MLIILTVGNMRDDLVECFRGDVEEQAKAMAVKLWEDFYYGDSNPSAEEAETLLDMVASELETLFYNAMLDTIETLKYEVEGLEDARGITALEDDIK